MANTIITSAAAFISTNIDNFLLLLVFYAQAKDGSEKRLITLGQYAGLGVLVLLSMLGTLGVSFFPQRYIGLLGIIPFALGIRELIRYKKAVHTEPLTHATDMSCDSCKPPETSAQKGGVWRTAGNIQAAPARKWLTLWRFALLYITSGADNIGVYISVFSGYSNMQTVSALLIFALLMALMCVISGRISCLSLIRDRIQRYKDRLLPYLFMALGIYIFLKS